MSEDQLQAAAYQWLHNTYPDLRGLFFAVPNGGYRNVIEASKLKATGVVPGIPDCVLIWPVAAGFEFKTASGTLSPKQKKIHLKWKSKSREVYVIRTVEEFKEIIKALL